MRVPRYLALVVIPIVLGLLLYPLAWKLATGGSVVVVAGGSMQPTYDYGDVLFLSERSGHDLVAGEPVVVRNRLGHDYVHRVSRVLDDGTAKLKGDNNEVEDVGTVAEADVVGTPRAEVQGPLALPLAASHALVGKIVLALVLLAWILMPSRRRARHVAEKAAPAVGSAVASSQRVTIEA